MIEIEYKKNLFFTKMNFEDLYEKNFGEIKNKILYLSIYEVAFLCKKNKIKNKKFEEIEKLKNFDMKVFLVYFDLKKKNYNVKSAFKFGFDFRVYDKGIKKNENHSLWFLKVIDEKFSQKIKEFSKDLRISNTAKKKMIYCVVDDEMSITYYENRFFRFS